MDASDLRGAGGAGGRDATVAFDTGGRAWFSVLLGAPAPGLPKGFQSAVLPAERKEDRSSGGDTFHRSESTIFLAPLLLLLLHQSCFQRIVVQI